MYLKVLFVALFLLHSTIGFTQNKDRSIVLERIKKSIQVDGILSDAEWNSIEPICSGLLSPWTEEVRDNTVFKAFVSYNYFYFSFDVEDSTLTIWDFENELSVTKEDRVELFFAKDLTLDEYFCLEIDPLGRVLDYKAKYYRQFDRPWKFQDIKIAAKKTNHGYRVEGRISLKELKNLGMGNQFFLGIFRADYRSKNEEDVTWYSMKKPKSNQPDFHIPTSFEKVIISQQ